MRIKKKFEAGAATNYISRNQAIKKLSITIKDFRRLCILKGIYPHEPKHKKKVNKGSTAEKTYYYVKDIQFLAHEPLINKFREHKHFIRRLKKAKAKRERGQEAVLRHNEPKYRLDSIVIERYPSLVDAVRDMDDSLCLCFLFARLPRGPKVKVTAINLCRRLTVEFMHYVIAAKALRKVFVSIKGIYYQAEIKGQTITWIVPHERGPQPVTDVDFAVMSTFVEFYNYMLGFVNFGLYRSLGLHYPPKLMTEQNATEDDPESTVETVYSLGQELEKVPDMEPSDVTPIDEAPMEEEGDVVRKMWKEQERIQKLGNLFSKERIFLSREVPREALTFIIRACGGVVSWDSNFAYGATFEESDESITIQIVDRPEISKRNINRVYVQPQWIFDCVNARTLLKQDDYFPGVILPPHLSPFVEERPGDYIPPERLKQLREEGQVRGFTDIDDLLIENATKSVEPTESGPAKKRKKKNNEKVEEEGVKMEVRGGEVKRTHPQMALNEKGEQLKLREMMIPKKQRRVYQKIKWGKKSQQKQTQALMKKRRAAATT